MRVFGYDITVRKSVPRDLLQPVTSSSWFNIIQESFSGAWQRNVQVRLPDVLGFSTVYACVTLIASDIGKIGLHLVEKDSDGIWTEVEVAAFSPVLRKPNRFQTRQKFIENWITSKLIHGNTYVLKERDDRKVVRRLYVLDPQLTRALVAPDGSVYYQVSANFLFENLLPQLAAPDEIAKGAVIIPASEIIHDVNVPLYHPLCGVSPISACGLAAVQGLSIQNNSTTFFQNGSRPGGILTAPGLISDTTAQRLKDHWEANYTGANAGKIAVLGDGLKYEGMTTNAVDAELIAQLKWTSETVCSAFHVPPYMVGIGPPPNYNNIEALNQQYYSQCLQTLMEAIEALLDDGLGLRAANQTYGTEFCLDDLLKMDTSTQYETFGNGIKAGLLAPNEARLKLNLPPVDGGDTPYLQQQNFSLEALNKRDTKEDPFATAKPPAAAPAPKQPAQVAPPPQKLLPDLRIDGAAIQEQLALGADEYASL